jgi:stearoyl-CoA desaturase (delta-9 desaturase)
MLITFVIGFIWYQIIAHIGVSAGLHRYFSHKAFKTNAIVETIMLYCATIAGARSPIGWVGAHRMHHTYTETERDPHSPTQKGFWNIVFNRWDVEKIPKKFSKDLFANKRLKFFHRHWKLIWGISAIIAVLISLEFFFAFIILPFIISYIGFGLENAITHKTGYAQDVPWLNLITAGEGYHKQHHSGKQLRYHKFDITGFILEKIYR